MNAKQIVLFVLIVASSSSHAEPCNPPPKDVATLKPLRPQLHTVQGVLAEFDPCHSSVRLQKPFFSENPPLIILAHGGAGLDNATKNAADAFRGKGFATLVFDAFELNGFYQGPRFWASQATNESRQRMIYKATLGAYEWAIKRNDVNTHAIYFHGLSNGGTVVINIAGAVSPANVKGVFAEGAPGMGLGLPNEIRVPLRLVYGKLDNYGGKTESDWIWTRQEPCSFNVGAFMHPKGSSQTCSAHANNSDLTAKPIDWHEEQKKNGADVEVWFYENAAHGIFVGPLQKNTITYGVDNKRFAWIGADSAARTKLLGDIERLHKDKGSK